MRTAATPSHNQRDPLEAVSIRMAVPADGASLSRLAALDSARPPVPGPTLVAEVHGELRAALPLGDGRAIADPFEPTAGLVAILAERARQLEPPKSSRSARRRRIVQLLRPAASTRA